MAKTNVNPTQPKLDENQLKGLAKGVSTQIEQPTKTGLNVSIPKLVAGIQSTMMITSSANQHH